MTTPDLTAIAYSRASELWRQVSELTAQRAALAPGSKAWRDVSTKLAAANAAWLAWSSEGPTLADIDQQLRAARAQEHRLKAARSPWVAGAAAAGGLAAVLGLCWLLVDTAPLVPTIALVCLAAAGVAVALDALARRSTATRLADLDEVRAALAAEQRQVIARYQDEVLPPTPAAVADAH